MKTIFLLASFLVGCCVSGGAGTILEMAGCLMRQVAFALEGMAWGLYSLSFYL